MRRFYEAVYLIFLSDEPDALPVEHTMAFEAQNKALAQDHAMHCIQAAPEGDLLCGAALDRINYLGLKKPDYEMGVLR